MRFIVTSDSLDSTEQIARQLADNLRGGETIELIGDLGAGKTTLVRGLVPALGGSDDVASPSFTISRVYKTAKFEVHHFDFYRLNDPGIIALELAELVNDSKAVVIVEWGESVRHVLANKTVTISIQAVNDEARVFEFDLPPVFEYMARGIK